jgi:hypothetical protein
MFRGERGKDIRVPSVADFLDESETDMQGHV